MRAQPSSPRLGQDLIMGNPGEEQLLLEDKERGVVRLRNGDSGGQLVVAGACTANGERRNGNGKEASDLAGGEEKSGSSHFPQARVRVAAERVISLKRLWEEVDTKRARTLLSGSFFRYVVFVALYLVALHHQKNAEPKFYLTSALRSSYVEASYTDPRTGALVSFEDIEGPGDFWMWMERKFLPVTFDTVWSNGDVRDPFYQGALLGQNRILKGFRVTQRRSESGNCLLIERFNAFFPFCFPNTFDEGRRGAISREPFGPYYNATKYQYTDYDSGAGWQDSGFIVSFPEFDAGLAQRRVQEMKSDRWIDEATRWLRVDLATYNPSANLFAHIEFILDLDNTGKFLPRMRVTTMKTDVYLNTVRDYVQIVLEILVMIGVVMFAVGDAKDCLILRGKPGGIGKYWSNFWNWVDFLLIVLFALDFTVWMLIITDGSRNDMEVKLGPTVEGAGQVQRDVLKDSIEMYGQSVTLWSVREKYEVYWAAQSFTLMIVCMRLLKYLAINSFLGTLVESFVVMKTALLQFILMVVVGNVAFAYAGYCLFGDEMIEFHSFDQAFFTLLATCLGDGITYAELAAVNPVGAPILYLPFVLFFCFITLNMVVAIIVEAYQVQQAHRAKHVGLAHQIKMGLARHVPAFRRYVGREEQWRYKGPDAGKLREWLADLDRDEDGLDDEVTEEELYERLLDKNVRMDDVRFIFKRYKYCTRSRDPPPPEPEVNDMVRELHKLVRTLADSHSVAQRKLDAIIAGQDM